MKHWWIVLLGSGIFAGAQEATAQEGGWMVHLDSLQTPEWSSYAHGGVGRSIREVPGGYLAFCEQNSPHTAPPPFYTHIFTRLFDSDGNYIEERFFGMDSMNVNLGFIDPIDVHPDGGFVACLGHWWGTDQIFQICLFDEQGDTTSCKEFLHLVPNDSIRIAFRDMVVLPDGDFLLGGWREDSGPPARGFLVRLDAQGEIIWSNIYDNSSEIQFVSHHPLGGFVLAGYRSGGVQENVNFIMRVSENGSEVWRRLFGGFGSAEAIASVNSDGTMVTWCRYRDQWMSGTYPQWKMLSKWDEDGALVWQRLSDHGYSNTYDVESLPDGGYIATGMTGGLASLDRFDANGDSLWTRQLWWFWNWNILHDVELASDGGFIATGRAQQTAGDPTPGLWTIVILKTDSLGCVVPGCHTVGVEEYAVDLQEYLRVWPNPVARGMPLQLAFSPPEGFAPEGRLRVVLQDALGREVFVEQLAPQPSTVQLPTSQLSSGIYYLHLADEQRWLAGAKIIVE